VLRYYEEEDLSTVNVELINTGSELLLGITVNTHLAYLGKRLLSLGLRISRQVTVPDSSAIRTALEEALPRCDIVLITGGLGPTTDDLTRDVVAELLNRPLYPNAEIHSKIKDRLTRLGVPFRKNMLCQTMVPEGAQILPNEYGTAPGLYLPATLQPRTPHIFLFPGPPQELKPMFEKQGIAILTQLAANGKKREQRIFSVTSIGETAVEERIGLELSQDGRLEVGYCPRFNEVEFRLIGPSDVLEEVTPRVYKALGTHIISHNGDSLEKVVVECLHKKKETLTIAESCTGGLLAHRITNIPGASEVFSDGFIVYSNQAKSKRLGVPASLIESQGAVSKAVAQEMAARALSLSGATHALSLTGIAGPGGGSPEKPVGTVFIGLASQQLPIEVCSKLFLAERATFKQLATQTALDMLRRRLCAL
jgi:nicotinamide-nucleotide amidase